MNRGTDAGVHERAVATVPAFSVVIPAFNAAGTLEATVRSVLAQTMGDFEVIVVDDGSTDGTTDVAEALAAEDSRVRLVVKPNGGCASARNAGCRAARAPLIALLDSDDLYAPEYLDSMGDLIGRHPECSLYSCNGVRRKGERDTRVFNGRAFSKERSFTLEEMIRANRMFVMAVFRKTLYEQVGGFREALPYGEDYDFWLRCFAAGALHVYTPQVLGVHIRSASSKSSNLIAHANGISEILSDLGARADLDESERAALGRAQHALEMRVMRVQLEQRLRAADYRNARSTYLRTRAAYISGAKFLGGLLVILLSPRLYAALLVRR